MESPNQSQGREEYYLLVMVERPNLFLIDCEDWNYWVRPWRLLRIPTVSVQISKLCSSWLSQAEHLNFKK